VLACHSGNSCHPARTDPMNRVPISPHPARRQAHVLATLSAARRSWASSCSAGVVMTGAAGPAAAAGTSDQNAARGRGFAQTNLVSNIPAMAGRTPTRICGTRGASPPHQACRRGCPTTAPACQPCTVRHPDSGIGDVQQDVDGLTSADQHGVLPHQVRFHLPVAGHDQEPAGAVHVERVVHRVIGVHLVDQPDLHLVTDPEPPGDPVVPRSGVPVEKDPPHVRRGGHPVHLDHVVLPLDALAGRLLARVMVMRGRGGLTFVGCGALVVGVPGGRPDQVRGQ